MTHAELLRRDAELAIREGGMYYSGEYLSRMATGAESLEAENAKLREQIHWLKKGDILHVLTDQEFAEQQKHEREMQASIKALDDENAKLRELCVKALEWLRLAGGITCPPEVPDEFADELRELGVEVDDGQQ